MYIIIIISYSLVISHLLDSFFHLTFQTIRAFLICISFFFRFNSQVFWSVRLIVLVPDLLPYFLKSLRYQYCESHGCLSTLVFSSSCTSSYNAPFFEILWSRLICCEGISSWPCLWLFLICSSVFCGSSFLHLLLTFFFFLHSSIFLIVVCVCVFHGFFVLLLSFPSCPSQPVSHRIQHTFLDIVSLHLRIPTFTFSCTVFFF